jgi:sugar-specific transcriptional regulator TrmB
MKEQTPLKPLIELGLTGLESEIYVFLVKNSPATGYRIANGIDKPTANTYKALRAMITKGIVMSEDGAPRTFRAVPTPMLLSRLEKRFHLMKTRAEAELGRLQPAPEDEKIYRLHTAEQVYERLGEMLRTSKKIVLLDLFPAALTALESEILAAVRRGVEVLLKLYRPAEMPGCLTVVAPAGAEIMSRWPGVGVNCISDGREYLIAFLSGDAPEPHDALWSRSEVISANYHGAMFSEIMLLALQEGLPWKKIDLPPKYRKMLRLQRQLLPGYGRLLRRYRRKKNDKGE